MLYTTPFLDWVGRLGQHDQNPSDYSIIRSKPFS
jgi:hypothetical protein